MPAANNYANTIKKLICSTVALVAIALACEVPARAGFANPVVPANDISNQLMQNPQTPQPPPPGSAGNPTPVTPGDTNAPSAVASGQADQTPGTNLPVAPGTSISTVRIFVNTAGGLKMVQTLRPSSLSAQNLGQIQGILGVNMTSGEPIIDVTATTAQMDQINQVLFPYPQTQNQGGRLFINSDSPAPGYPKETAAYNFQGPLPTVRTFSRYLVILGVVAATVFIAFAATAVVLGHPYAGARVVGSISGLMLLLMGYTIWKIVQMNTFIDNQAPTGNPVTVDLTVQNNQQSGQGAVTNYPQQNTPVVPAQPNTPARSPMPVIPLSGN
jgi:hypothetical protein